MRDLMGRDDFEHAVGAGAILNLDIRLVSDGSGGLLVGLIYRDRDGDRHVGLTPAQARQLAEWLRLAAMPGETVGATRPDPFTQK
jgi:hypothetical protein